MTSSFGIGRIRWDWLAVAVVPRLNTLGVTISAQLANRQPASPAMAPHTEKIAVL